MAQTEGSKRKNARRRASLTREVCGLLAERAALMQLLESLPAPSRLRPGGLLDLRFTEQCISDVRIRFAKLNAVAPLALSRRRAGDDAVDDAGEDDAA